MKQSINITAALIIRGFKVTNRREGKNDKFHFTSIYKDKATYEITVLPNNDVIVDNIISGQKGRRETFTDFNKLVSYLKMVV